MSGSSKPTRPTIYDVARQAGVSKSLVSLVLRNAPHVAEAKREAVKAAIAELGYRPSRAASALASQRTNSVGLLIDDFRNPWFVELLSGLRSVLDPAGFTVAVADLRLETASGRNPVDGFLAQHVDALVIAAEAPVDMLRNARVPLVVAGSRGLSAHLEADVVTSDDGAGGRMAAEHLLAAGHRSIVHLSGTGEPAAHRRRGYRDAMSDAGREPLVFGTDGGTDEADGFRGMQQALAAVPEPDAVFAANDLMAAGALAALRDSGLSVPERVSLIGYDNSPLAAYEYLRLSSVDPHNREIGAESARMVLSRLESPDAPPRRTLLGPTVVERSSVAVR
ncbi:LacI family transcriptional regulator [Arthrobacter sp. SW1]|uniref:LacI family DNA-binding transcriptional regulator n=1 Tax=Arthrobacter sp. SW1 TaxID=1920889 RepID=UPI000877B4E8|nr:LacI family DNA-binding transcriptional regulator [Arthrobacter sp. SW1]OFI37852.1 LacI family transcriptional regulator [Arthrobacter sp. SW1]